ncbi:MAG: urease subunit gamma [Clostridia bacterium]
MRLTPREQDKLMLFLAGTVAKERKSKGIKLNYPEAIALISSEIVEKAREGADVCDLMSYGRKILTKDDVLSGVAEMIEEIQVEANFLDGTKLVTIHNPIETTDEFIPGEYFIDDGEIELNAGTEKCEISVQNTADRPVQVGSHFHFFEVNSKLSFDRKASFGMRLDIPSGTATRFEPGEAKIVTLTAISGERKGFGLNGLTDGAFDDENVKNKAFEKACALGFKGV